MFKEKLQAAFDKRGNDINSYTWKGRKQMIDGQVVQDEKKLVDCTPGELRGFYAHCESMLRNTNKEYPGRYVLLDVIKDQRMRCNAELFLRWMESDMGVKRFVFLETLRGFLDVNREVIRDPKDCPINVAVGECPQEYANIPADVVMEGCLDRLGKFNKQHLTLTFILKQGLWCTKQENAELALVKDNSGNARDKSEVVKERLGLKPTINLYLSPKGLSFAQLRAMVNLKSKKYAELTTEQLKTLRNRVLFSLEDEVNFHIGQWEERKKQIEAVCEAKGITL